MAVRNTFYAWFRIFLLTSVCVCMVGCQELVRPGSSAAAQSPVLTSEPTILAPRLPTVETTATKLSLDSGTVSYAPYLPLGVIEALQAQADLVFAETAHLNNLRLDLSTGNPIAQWVYALVGPFATIPDQVSEEKLLAAWRSGPQNLLLNQYAPESLLVSQNTLVVFTQLWGEPSDWVKVASESRLVEQCWDQNAWAIVPFETLEPRWKVIAIDDQSPVHKDFRADGYALSVPISLTGPQELVRDVTEKHGLGAGRKLISNRDPSRLTTVVMTGVTALVRATAATMQIKGVLYPGQDIRDWLLEADYTHINNEIPFTPRCPLQHDASKGLVFCSRPEYVQLLEDIGTDIVELTGDHFADWGAEAMLYTLEMYDNLGWETYGGGRSITEGRQPVLLSHNGNKLAFLGCNAKSPGYASASATNPGAVHCDMDWLTGEIERLRADGYLPIVTFQHEEVWSYEANPYLVPDFRTAAGAGAVIVSGSQAHQPQAFDFYKDSLIHYGLGNLFFDQYSEGIPNRQAFIDRHVFYDGRYLSTEPLTIEFIDYARPRPMTPEEREELLLTIFGASGWLDTNP